MEIWQESYDDIGLPPTPLAPIGPEGAQKYCVRREFTPLLTDEH